MTSLRNRFSQYSSLAMVCAILLSCSADIPEGRFGCKIDQECPDAWFCRVVASTSEARCFSSANAGALPPACPDKAPLPNNQTGTCCYRESNARRLTSPVLRIASLKPTSPLSFTEPALVDARQVPVPVGAAGANLCSVLSGMPFESDPCGNREQTRWAVKPDSQCDNLGCTQNNCTPETCNAWRIQASFAAQGVDVSFQPPA